MSHDVSPVLAKVVAELGQTLGRVSNADALAAVVAIEQAPRVFLAGAGRSGLAIRGFAMRLMHLGKQAYVVGETTTPAIAKGDLLLIGSGSGRTASLQASAKRARELGATIVLVTIDPTSPIGALAHVVVQIPAPSPKAAVAEGASASVQPMGSLFEQALFLLLDSLVVVLMQRGQINSEAMFTRHANLE